MNNSTIETLCLFMVGTYCITVGTVLSYIISILTIIELSIKIVKDLKGKDDKKD